MPKTIKILIAAALGATFAGQACAHAHLKSAMPAPESTVKTAPRSLDLTFTEDLNLTFSGVTITGPHNTLVKLGKVMLMDNNTTLTAPIADALAPGSYSVQWHALSADGHKTKGKYGFIIKP
jgi:methionine-rich copper-binding protein CopC